MATYDSAKVREIAIRIRQLANDVEATVKPAVRSAREEMDPLRGKTAEAMEERLMQLHTSVDKLAQEYALLAHLANTYADQLEKTDQELAEKL